MEPTLTSTVVSGSNPQKDALECRMKRVEIIAKIQRIRSDEVIDQLTVERMTLENKQLERQGSGYNSPLDQLMNAARACVIDNDKTIVGSEPAIRSMWDEDEMAEIKSRIMAKLRKL